jgi:hypothetical protein
MNRAVQQRGMLNVDTGTIKESQAKVYRLFRDEEPTEPCVEVKSKDRQRINNDKKERGRFREQG